MKLKYYLRGIGIGVIVTAVIMTITNKPQEMTDEQIKARAMELGMVEENVLSDLADKNVIEIAVEAETLAETEADIAKIEEEAVSEVEETEEIEMDSEVEETEETEIDSEVEEMNLEAEEIAEEEETISEEVKEEEEAISTEEKEEVEVEESITEEKPALEAVENYVIINVEKGNGSEIVSKRLYEAGLVESAIEYNQFLVKNGYDRKLSIGNHEIPAGTTYEEMAHILCGMK